MYKNVEKQTKIELKDLVSYQEGQVVSKTLVQNDYVSMTIFLVIGSAVLFATIFILIFAILLRVTTIRKQDIVTESEIIFTKWLIIVSSVLAFIVGILSANIKLIGCVIGLSWQQPLFMMLIYYLPLKNRFKKGTEIAHTEL